MPTYLISHILEIEESLVEQEIFNIEKESFDQLNEIIEQIQTENIEDQKELRKIALKWLTKNQIN